MTWTPFTRAQHDRSSLRFESDLTDQEWSLLAPLLPAQPLRGRRCSVDMRAVMEGIFYVLQSGCAWRLIPKEFPPESTVHGYFQRFVKEGIWDQIMGLLHEKMREKAGRDSQPTYAIVDSQSTKIGPNASRDKGFDAGKKLKGRKPISLSTRSALS